MFWQIKPKSKRQWQAVLGIDNQSFEQLLKWCKQEYIILKNCTFEESLEQNPKGSLAKIRSIDDLIFYTLFMLKSGITFDLAAYLIQFDQSRAHRQFVKGIDLLHRALFVQGFLPFRDFESPEYFQTQFTRAEVLIIDATEHRIQRPQDKEFQHDTYSGKKKTNTLKSMIISTLDRYIHYVSVCYVGRTHDYSLLHEEFDPDLNWFDGYQVRVDLGYQGFAKDYPNAILDIPNKKPRGGQLTEEQKQFNRQLAKQRISVEHTIGGMKRYDILSNPCRIHDYDVYNKMTATCAGIWNFFITN